MSMGNLKLALNHGGAAFILVSVHLPEEVDYADGQQLSGEADNRLRFEEMASGGQLGCVTSILTAAARRDADTPALACH